MKKIMCALELEHPTTTVEGKREYKRMERQIQKAVKDDRRVLQWQKIKRMIKQALIDFWNEEL